MIIDRQRWIFSEHGDDQKKERVHWYAIEVRIHGGRQVVALHPSRIVGETVLKWEQQLLFPLQLVLLILGMRSISTGI